MSPGQLADFIVTLVLMAMVSIIGYLLKGRFDAQDKTLTELGNRLDTLESASTTNTVAIARLVESQRFMVENQTTISRSQERLVEVADDLEDVNDQLQGATRSLRDRMEAHEKFHRTILQNRDDRNVTDR